MVGEEVEVLKDAGEDDWDRGSEVEKEDWVREVTRSEGSRNQRQGGEPYDRGSDVGAKWLQREGDYFLVKPQRKPELYFSDRRLEEDFDCGEHASVFKETRRVTRKIV